MRSLVPIVALLLQPSLGRGESPFDSTLEIGATLGERPVENRALPKDVHLPEENETRLNVSTRHTPSGLFGGVGLSLVQRNLSQLLVRDKKGVETPLSQVSGAWSVLRSRANLGWQTGMFTFQGQGEHSLGRDDFALRSGGLGASFKSWEWGLDASWNSTISERHRPASTFLDRDFRSKPRPRSVLLREHSFELDQLIWERIKIGGAIRLIDNRTERPTALGLAGRIAFAATDRLYFQGGLEDFKESRAESLQNERGYFAARRLWVRVIGEPVLDTLLDATLSQTQEEEEDPRVSEKTSLKAWHLGSGITVPIGTSKLSAGINSSFPQDSRTLLGGRVSLQTPF